MIELPSSDLDGLDQFPQEKVCGIDEAGRGPLAGPVVAAAVVLDPAHEILGIDDSKRLTETTRNSLADSICEHASAWGLGKAEASEIDQANILQATLRAMERAYASINQPVELALIDGNIPPRLDCRTITVVNGDATMKSIGAASILAKVWRDAEMVSLAAKYPEYGFERNKGYPTREHLDALQRYGPCPIHRRSFGPVAKVLLRIK